MSDDLFNELEAINAIYGEHTVQTITDHEDGVYLLALHQHDVTLRLSFPPAYPNHIPQILGTETTWNSAPKGHGSHVLTTARHVLSKNFCPGNVCLFDLIQELDLSLGKGSAQEEPLLEYPVDSTAGCVPDSTAPPLTFPPPIWILSTSITEKKSVFLARACGVTSPDHVQFSISDLLSTDKRAAKATHNISAYRIRSNVNDHEVTYQDCDDDGETAAGSRLLHLLQVMDVWGVLVVVSRWYGGVQLGADRFRCINAVAREAVVDGGWMKMGTKVQE